MNLEEYAARQAQNVQQAQPAPDAQQVEAQPLEQVAAQMGAARLSSLMAELQEAIDAEETPAQMLTAITTRLYGKGSAQAAAVKAIIDADRHPGGHELTVAAIRQQRKSLHLLQRRLKELQEAAAAELEKLDAEEHALVYVDAQTAALDNSIADILTACRGIRDLQPDSLQQLQDLYNRHRKHPAAMGLLYGSIRQMTSHSTGGLDIAQQVELEQLQAAILAAAQNRG